MILHACELPACPWPCLSRVGRFLPLLAFLTIAGVVQRCLISAWRYLALLTFAGVAGRSLTAFSVACVLLRVIWRCLPLLALLFSCCDHDGWLDPVLFFIVSFSIFCRTKLCCFYSFTFKHISPDRFDFYNINQFS